MRVLICGPKLAACGMVLSTWGVIMLVSVTLCCPFSFCCQSSRLHFRKATVKLQHENTIFLNSEDKTSQAVSCTASSLNNFQAVLGIFFTTHSAVLMEDVPLTYKDIYEDTNPQRIYDLYNSVGYNCFIAAAVYVLFGVFACCQMRLNKQKELVQ